MYKNVSHMFVERVKERSDYPAIQYKEKRGAYQFMKWQQYGDLVKELAFGLASLGLAPGGTAAIFSQGSYLWVASDFATMANGAKSVPIYPTSSLVDIQAILANSEATIIFVQDNKLLKKIVELSHRLPLLKTIVVLHQTTGENLQSESEDGLSVSQNEADPSLESQNEKGALVISSEELRMRGREFEQTNPNLITERTNQINVEDPATIIYTSGTTGVPKGAVLTHSNILSVINAIKPVLPISEADVYLSYLPLSHVFERICGEFYWAYCGGIIAFAESIESMAKNLAECQPTFILVVPRVLDRIYSKVKSGIAGASPRSQKLINWALEVGKEALRTKSDGKPLRLGLKIKHALSEKLVFKPLREKIGKRLRLVVSGGAPATPSVIEFFNSIGVPTIEGYGLTETCAPTHANPPDRVRVGTVGKALPSVEVKIAADGEILLRGPSIVKGYFKNPENTSESFKDGWFMTGDIGSIDVDGYLRITDRKKDLIFNEIIFCFIF